MLKFFLMLFMFTQLAFANVIEFGEHSYDEEHHNHLHSHLELDHQDVAHEHEDDESHDSTQDCSKTEHNCSVLVLLIPAGEIVSLFDVNFAGDISFPYTIFLYSSISENIDRPPIIS
jgi:hypothetical protein